MLYWKKINNIVAAGLDKITPETEKIMTIISSIIQHYQ